MNQNLPITQQHPKSPVAEAYRSLRTNLGFASIDEPCRILLVTSPNPLDGKTTTASNLAVTMAQTGGRVLLVDCDLRKPMQQRIFDQPNQRGLTSYLSQDVSLDEIIHKAVVPNLDLITSGPIPPNPAEILGSEKIRSIWPLLLQRYDQVVVDCPPVLAVADSSILASQVDGIILVVRSHRTRKDMAQRAREQLMKAGAHLVGVVLNDLDMNSKDYQYYYYYAHKENKPGKLGMIRNIIHTFIP